MFRTVTTQKIIHRTSNHHVTWWPVTQDFYISRLVLLLSELATASPWTDHKETETLSDLYVLLSTLQQRHRPHAARWCHECHWNSKYSFNSYWALLSWVPAELIASLSMPAERDERCLSGIFIDRLLTSGEIPEHRSAKLLTDAAAQIVFPTILHFSGAGNTALVILLPQW